MEAVEAKSKSSETARREMGNIVSNEQRNRFFRAQNSFLNGRTFTESEVNGKRKLAVINETFANKYMKGENPIGQRIHIARLETFPDPVKDAWFEVIGVVADSKNQGLQDPVYPEAWVPYTMTGSGGRGILVRTAQIRWRC